jgi:[ribosomal protein S18]-alanine N-acetyltransferase
MSSIIIEKTNIDHIDDIMDVERLSFKIPWSREAFVTEISVNRFSRYFSAVVEGRVVGYAGLWKVCDEGHITNIAVHPDFRGRGIGSLLMDMLIHTSAMDNIERMTLEVRKSNIAAQKLYYKYGFTACGERRHYYADNDEDAVIMWKDNVQEDQFQKK